jgi:hypothetical protein
MAQQNLVLGTTDNDGTGEGNRDTFLKIEANTTEIYESSGWCYIEDAETTPATQVIDSTPVKLQIDGGGSNTSIAYLPREIRGVSTLWDTTNDKITPITLGDAYDLRIDLEITAKSASPSFLYFVLDIGGAAGITVSVVERIISVGATPTYTISVGFPIFCLATFITNGGQIFLSTDTGTLTISRRALFIKRDYKGDL